MGKLIGGIVKLNFKKMLVNDRVKPYLLKARYGIEKESKRVDLSGNLAKTDHPKSISLRDDHPYIQRDFSELQMEIITPVTETLEELFDYLAAIHDVAYRSMGKNEMLWPLSMPPQLPEKDEDIVIAKLKNAENVQYRQTLSNSYGRRKQMLCGVHFNFEFGDELIQALFNAQSEIKDYQHFKTEMYLKATRNYLHHRWLFTYFYGSSPSSEKNFFEEDSLKEVVRSIRSSKYGYTNSNDVQVSYSSIQNYVSDLSLMVKRGLLSAEREFYSPVRLRGGHHASDLEDHGISYIELRNIDLNPFETYGFSYEQAEFLHLFLIYLLWKDEGENCDEWVKMGDFYTDIVALEHPLEHTQFEIEAKNMINEMEQLAETLNLTISETLFVQLREMLMDPSKTLAGRLYKESEKSSQGQVATSIAKENYKKSWDKPYQLAGFTDMELSTQILMFDAIQQGIQIEILDRQDQFLKLKLKDHVEYVKNGNMTSKDNYVSTLIMENKTVTKKILQQHGFRVPKGEEFQTIEQALRSYDFFATKPFVVKPKTTNYGLGISIFKEDASYKDYQQAITLAFKEDSSILVEEFLNGTEYRFFVLNNRVYAVLLRIPANVKGDGKHTIEELVVQKNRDTLRGRDHRTPLETIQLGELENLMLKAQGYGTDSIPENDEIVYLRENSNISTGGDSIDVTDHIPDDYKKIAVDAVSALGVEICGIDLIIENTEVPATNKNAYGIIEANFNPSMYMHIYPYKGESRRLTMHIIHYLFPELLKNQSN
ncbi:bifunctional glutamate--cysteine ligase GshA/glutathione synthetase GshB [Bacillus cereus]|uniref:bifunctional glutamate--cysteine ligase GshA/glutathione synthetase GshB n=1 Tax=Bacillus TaxID=1386 RepID=UPI00077AA2A5|nr:MULTISPECIES: bifunctional glutamate--cysteine ligase GshA/glutathione synthetase GshB [Bacillus]KXY71350.1 bifunctional glutamate--cysteine ligase/glutathione synthetase [Bacillus wiedmannii]MBY5228836.1 bifunctional glutamate--cysteine ligase/glutathione synthetase [Bacillus paranthracis]MDA2312536.1 bifunctional glutamate--cysteine ligase GshA/glutathione synthetase GshB [Bacillus cereus]OJD73038.1 bifunctional glutamate--cysteine ligase/glutathione synthetase [Bacillus sp. P14-1]ONG7268